MARIGSKQPSDAGSARQINQMVNGAGSVWSDESFDHIIRYAAELEEKLEYIRQNLVKRAQADHPDAMSGCLLGASQAKAYASLRKCLMGN